MSLHTTGEISVDVDRQTAFAVVKDPDRLARCIPGCENLQELGSDKYSAVLTSKVAFLTLRFKVVIDVIRMDPPSAIEARITGDAIGLTGHVVATASLDLTDAGEHRTTIRYATDVGLTGKLGGLGQPVFRATSARIAKEFGANLRSEIEREGAARSA
jgi:carbon monoxide dehydrogenase subunit G